MKSIAFSIVLCLALVSTAFSSDKQLVIEGMVVAVQKTKDEVRMVDPHAMGDMVEVWMVKVPKWPRSEKTRFILVEYTHRAPLVTDSELDSTVWKFEVRPAPAADSRTCMSWWSADQSFVPTALGVGKKLPPPKGLDCFLMQKRPIAVRALKSYRRRSDMSTTAGSEAENLRTITTH